MRTQLVSYLEAGGSVYFEGNDIGYSNRTYEIWPYTGLNYVGDGSSASTGNVQGITGSLMCSGMEFGYPYKSEADGYVDYFSPNGGAMVFTSQDDLGRVGCYSGPSNNYRTITSSVFFSVFQENATTKQELMAAYMEFLTGGTGSAGDPAAQINPVTASVASPSTGMISLCISLPREARCSLGVYDVSGRKVGTMVDAAVSAGNHTFAVSGSGLVPGTYFVCGKAGELTVSERTVLLR